MKKNNILFFAFTLVVGSLLGCSSASKLPCATTDWYELGRQKGASGAPSESPENLEASCKTADGQLDAKAQFESGHSLGLSEYCSERNGYQLAKMNHSYKPGTCPQLLEDAFLKGYKSGLEAVQLSRDRKNIQNKMQRIEGNLLKDDIHISRRALLQAEKIELLEKEKSIDKKMADFKRDYESEIDIDDSIDPSFFVQ